MSLNKFLLLICTTKPREWVIFEQMFEIKVRAKLDMDRYFWPYLGSYEFEGALPLGRVYPG